MFRNGTINFWKFKYQILFKINKISPSFSTISKKNSTSYCSEMFSKLLKSHKIQNLLLTQHKLNNFKLNLFAPTFYRINLIIVRNFEKLDQFVFKF